MDEWVTVVEGSSWSIGEIIHVHGDNILINIMENTLMGKNLFKWPNKKIEKYFEIGDVLCSVTAPNPANNRGRYSMSLNDFERICKITLKQKKTF